MLKCERAAMYKDFLASEGYRAEIDEDGDVRFKCEGTNLFISVEDDEEFFRLILPNFWSIDSPGEKANAVRAAHDVTRELKVAKVFCTSNNNVWATVEAFYGEVEGFKPIFNRSVRVIKQALATFAEKMRQDVTQ